MTHWISNERLIEIEKNLLVVEVGTDQFDCWSKAEEGVTDLSVEGSIVIKLEQRKSLRAQQTDRKVEDALFAHVSRLWRRISWGDSFDSFSFQPFVEKFSRRHWIDFTWKEERRKTKKRPERNSSPLWLPQSFSSPLTNIFLCFQWHFSSIDLFRTASDIPVEKHTLCRVGLGYRVSYNCRTLYQSRPSHYCSCSSFPWNSSKMRVMTIVQAIQVSTSKSSHVPCADFEAFSFSIVTLG